MQQQPLPPQPAQAPRAPAEPQPAQEAAPGRPATARDLERLIDQDPAIHGLRIKRAEINRQMESLTDRRDELQQQREKMSPEAGRGHDERIRIIDQRTASLERELLQVEEQLSRAVSNLSGQAVVSAGGGAGGSGRRSDVVGVAQRDELADEVRRAASSGAEDGVVGALAGTGAFLFFAFVIYRGARRWIWKRKPAPAVGTGSFDAQQIAQLQRSLDVVAVEVERIAEAQRYVAKLLNERALGAGEAQPAHSRANADPVERR